MNKGRRGEGGLPFFLTGGFLPVSDTCRAERLTGRTADPAAPLLTSAEEDDRKKTSRSQRRLTTCAEPSRYSRLAMDSVCSGTNRSRAAEAAAAAAADRDPSTGNTI